MEKLKKVLDRIFIDGLSGMAQGLFATLIIGTIVQQIGTLIGGSVGDMIFAIGKVAASLTGAGIGVGVAAKFKESQLVTVQFAGRICTHQFAVAHDADTVCHFHHFIQTMADKHHANAGRFQFVNHLQQAIDLLAG